MSFGGLSSTVHDLKIVFTGIDRVSRVADSIQTKVKALGGAIAILGGSGALVTNLAEQFGLLEKSQADSLNKTFSLITATGSLITIFARLIPVLQGLTIAQSLANAARAVALALSGPVGWGILAGAAVALGAFGVYMLTQQGGSTPSASVGRATVAGRPLVGQFGLDTMVSSPTMFLAGEAGRERVRITPEGREPPGAAISPTIHIHGAQDPDATARAVKRELEMLIERERIRRS